MTLVMLSHTCLFSHKYTKSCLREALHNSLCHVVDMAKKVPKKDPGDGGEERQTSKNNSWLSVVALNFLMIIIGVFIATIYPLYGAEDIVLSSSPVDQSVSQLLGAKGALLFRSLDADRDGNITYAEFAPIVEKLTGEVSI